MSDCGTSRYAIRLTRARAVWGQKSPVGWPVGAVAVLSLSVMLVASCNADSDEAGPAHLAYVSNEISGDLTVIDTATQTVTSTIPVGRRPRGVRASRDGSLVFVAVSGSPRCPPWKDEEECASQVADKSKDGIAIVDARAKTVVRTLPGGSDPEQFDLDPNETKLFVSNEDAGLLSIVDIASGKILAETPVGEEPEGVKVSPDGRYVLVTSESDHTVAVVSADTGNLVKTVPVCARPRDIIFDSAGTAAYVSCEHGEAVAVISMQQLALSTEIRLPEGTLPMGLQLSAGQDILYVATGRDGRVLSLRLSDGEVIGAVKTGDRPWGLAISLDGKTLFAANGPSNDVAVIDTRTMEVQAKIPAGESPWGVVIAPYPH